MSTNIHTTNHCQYPVIKIKINKFFLYITKHLILRFKEKSLVGWFDESVKCQHAKVRSSGFTVSWMMTSPKAR